jgi:hypothetical protein
MNARTLGWGAALGAATVLAVAFAAPTGAAEDEIVIRVDAVEPPVFHGLTGRRVNFVKRVPDLVHVEFGEDPAQHHVSQVPATGPIWAIFHRPGTHPYVVHIYGARTTTLRGLVEVVEDPEHPWGPGTCGAVVMGECFEP